MRPKAPANPSNPPANQGSGRGHAAHARGALGVSSQNDWWSLERADRTSPTDRRGAGRVARRPPIHEGLRNAA